MNLANDLYNVTPKIAARQISVVADPPNSRTNDDGTVSFITSNPTNMGFAFVVD